MRTIETRDIHFGELAGPLVHGSVLFNWELISTQRYANSICYSFEDLISEDEIPYAPVTSKLEINQYPSVGDSIAIDTTPIHVGDHRIDLQYDFLDEEGVNYGVGKIVHVSIEPDGGAKSLPEHAREQAERDCIGETELGFPDSIYENEDAVDPTYKKTFRIRCPHIEGSNLAYFEEYPRFAAIALEEYLEKNGYPLSEQKDNSNLRMKNVDWDFISPVAYGAALTVNATVLDGADETIPIAYSFEQDGRPLIEGWAEYSRFNENGLSIDLDDCMLETISGI